MTNTSTDQPSTWRPMERTRAYEFVVEQVEEQVLAGRLRVGDRIPGERELASHLQVSRAAVREGIRALEAQGVLRAGVGSGTDAGTVVCAMPSAALNRLLRLHVALSNFPIGDVVAARVMLERSSAALAAAKPTPSTLTSIAAPLTAMETLDVGAEGEDSRGDYNDLDTRFHVAIAEAGGNRLVSDMTIAIRESLSPTIHTALERLGPGWPAVRQRLTMEHQGIYDAIASGHQETAAALVERHILSAQKLLVDTHA